MLESSLKKKCSEILRYHFGEALEAAYIFGSKATGDATERSDLDLAVLCEKNMQAQIFFAAKTELSFQLKCDIDLIALNQADTVTKALIVSTGELIWAADPTKVAHFETVCLSAYALLNEERSGILQDIASRGRIYGR